MSSLLSYQTAWISRSGQKDRIQLRTPTGRVFETHIASIELLKPQCGGPCRMAIMLPRDLGKDDVPAGTEGWCV